MPAPHYDKKLSRSSRGKRLKWILLLSVAPRNAHADINGDSCDFVLRRARDILIGLPSIIARVIVSVITVISIFVPDVFEFDASSFQMLICQSTAMILVSDGAAGKSCVKFPWLSHPIMSPREERKKGLSPSGRRKKPCLDYISKLVGACSCASSNLS